MNSSARNIDLSFRMDVIRGAVSEEVFSYDQFNNSYDSSSQKFSLSGFSYDISDFKSEGDTKSFSASLSGGYDAGEVGFHDIITANAATGDAVIIYVSGFNSSVESSTTITRVIDGKMGTDGPPGPATHFRGKYDAGASYTGSELRGDIVYFSSNYWICVSANSPSTPKQPGSDPNFWKPFGAEFTSVATELLLTKEAIITEKIELGTLDPTDPPDPLSHIGHGIITSPGFTGSQYDSSNQRFYGDALFNESYDTPGFILGTALSGGEQVSFFDIGSTDSHFTFGIDGRIKMYSSFISGGINIQAEGLSRDTLDEYGKEPFACFVGGGYNNSIEIPNEAEHWKSIGSAILCGGENSITGRFSSILGGYNNDCSDHFSTIVGGIDNQMDHVESPGDFEAANVICGGAENVIKGGSLQFIAGGRTNKILNENATVPFPEDHWSVDSIIPRLFNTKPGVSNKFEGLPETKNLGNGKTQDIYTPSSITSSYWPLGSTLNTRGSLRWVYWHFSGIGDVPIWIAPLSPYLYNIGMNGTWLFFGHSQIVTLTPAYADATNSNTLQFDTGWVYIDPDRGSLLYCKNIFNKHTGVALPIPETWVAFEIFIGSAASPVVAAGVVDYDKNCWLYSAAYTYQVGATFAQYLVAGTVTHNLYNYTVTS